MAYSSTVTKTKEWGVGGRKLVAYTIVESGVTGSSNEWTITGAPPFGEVLLTETAFSAGFAGSATTVQPRLGETTTGTEIYSAGAGAASDRSVTTRRYYLSGGTFYGSSRANGTVTSGTITTYVVIGEGVP